MSDLQTLAAIARIVSAMADHQPRRDPYLDAVLALLLLAARRSYEVLGDE